MPRCQGEVEIAIPDVKKRFEPRKKLVPYSKQALPQCRGEVELVVWDGKRLPESGPLLQGKVTVVKLHVGIALHIKEERKTAGGRRQCKPSTLDLCESSCTSACPSQKRKRQKSQGEEDKKQCCKTSTLACKTAKAERELRAASVCSKTTNLGQQRLPRNTRGKRRRRKKRKAIWRAEDTPRGEQGEITKPQTSRALTTEGKGTEAHNRTAVYRQRDMPMVQDADTPEHPPKNKNQSDDPPQNARPINLKIPFTVQAREGLVAPSPTMSTRSPESLSQPLRKLSW